MSLSEEAARSVRAEIATELSKKEFVVQRDKDRPLSFAGWCLAEASIITGIAREEISAAVYRTAGGKFIATFARKSTMRSIASLIELGGGQEAPSEGKSGANREIRKAQVFDTLDQAFEWYRPGRLTDAIRKKLGLDEPIRIE